MRSILAGLIIAATLVSSAYARDVEGKGSAADQKEACKAAKDNARGASRKGFDFQECQCTQADGKFMCTVKGSSH